jgi:putative transposase
VKPENNPSVNRMNRGQKIAEEKTICENGDGSFSVPSATVEEVAYLVRLIDGKYVCNCLDFKHKELRQIEACKHIHATKFWIASQVEIKQAPKPKIFADDAVQCPKCASIRVVRNGHDSGKQVFKCRDCGHKFRELSLLKKAQYSPELVSLTLDLYFSGMSLRKIARTISDHYDQKLGYTTIYAWIQKYIPKISEYVNSLEPHLSDTWHADELFVKMQNGVDYRRNKSISFLWNVMDRKTRFLLASKLSPYRDRAGALAVFREAQKNAHGNFPEQVFTDSLASYAGVPYMRTKGWNIKMIKNAGINKPHATNNRIERMNGTLRERIKVQRGWKSFESQIAEGQRIHYNFVKPHEALEGMTPAQRAGIKGKNDWLSLLQSAMQ